MSLTDLVDRKEIAPFISFERKAVEDKEKSLKYGRYIAKDMDFVTIHSPYSRDTVIYKIDRWLSDSEEKVSRGTLKSEWFEDWKRKHGIWLSRQATPTSGTPVRGWGVISPAQQETIINMDILTVEDIIRSDKLHLIEGGKDIKQKAVTWLQALNDRGPLVQKLAELTAENERLKATVKSLEDKLNVTVKEETGIIGNLDGDVEDLKIDINDLLSAHAIEVPSKINPDMVWELRQIPENVISITPDSLADAYEKKFGKKPHHRMKNETILEALKD